METSLKYQLLELLIRLFCGIIFLFQGYDKLFRVKIRGVVELFQSTAHQKHIPVFMQYGLATYTSSIEFFGGIFLVLGLYKNIILALLVFLTLQTPIQNLIHHPFENVKVRNSSYALWQTFLLFELLLF